MSVTTTDEATPAFLTRQELAERYRCTAKSIANSPERWPRYQRIGRNALYSMTEVLKWESQQPFALACGA